MLPDISPLQISPHFYSVFFSRDCLQEIFSKIHFAMHYIKSVAD
jgi:hypothetical protein